MAIESARKDERHLTGQWDRLREGLDGVRLFEVKNLLTANSSTTEVFRTDWGVLDTPVEQIINVSFRPNALSAWHMHREKTDHLFVTSGSIKLVLYDGRESSPTFGEVDILFLGPLRPTLVVIPPGVWHGIQNIEGGPSSIVNFFDRRYDYDDPDEWRLPPDTDEIPYRF